MSDIFLLFWLFWLFALACNAESFVIACIIFLLFFLAVTVSDGLPKVFLATIYRSLFRKRMTRIGLTLLNTPQNIAGKLSFNSLFPKCVTHDKPCALAYSLEPAFIASEKAHETARN